MKFSKSIITKDSLHMLLFLLPTLLLVGFFVYYCIFWNFGVSLTAWNELLPNYEYVGFENYSELFKDTTFQTSLKNNLILLILFVPGCLIIGLILAILLDQKIKCENIFRTIFLIPFTLSFVVTGYLWQWMFNSESGVLNYILGTDSLWTSDPKLALYCIIIALVWQYSGYTMVILLAGIKSVPKSHIMAAKVDGASGFYIYRRVIIPQLKASFATAFVILVAFSLKAFDFVYILTGGGPGYSTEIMALTMYEEIFAKSHFAYGSAIATVIFGIVMVVVIPYIYRTYIRKEK